MSRIRRLIPQAAAAALILLLAGCSNGSENGLEPFQPPAQVNYDTCVVERGSFVKSATASAYFYYPVSAGLCATRENLRIAEITVTFSQEVKQGDVLVRLESEEGGAKLTELTQGLEALKRELSSEKDRRQRDIRDAKWDLKSEAFPSHERTILELKLKKLESEYGQYVLETERAIRLQEQAIQKQAQNSGPLELTAPFDGVVSYVTTLSAGDRTSKNQLMVAVSSTAEYLIDVGNDGMGFRYGMPVTLEAGRQDELKSYPATVVSAYNLLPSSAEFENHVLIQPDDPAITQEELSIVLRATGNVVEQSGVLITQRQAVKLSDGKNWVTILNGDMLQKRRVLTGQNDLNQTVILDGLTEGQQLLID